MKSIDDVRKDLGRTNDLINEAIGRATEARQRELAAVLLRAGEKIDAAVDDLSEIDAASAP